MVQKENTKFKLQVTVTQKILFAFFPCLTNSTIRKQLKQLEEIIFHYLDITQLLSYLVTLDKHHKVICSLLNEKDSLILDTKKFEYKHCFDLDKYLNLSFFQDLCMS
jgi:hypothetical protein